MLNSNAIQVCYNDLYVALREYIWDISIVEKIADLEIAAYQKFPDVEVVKRKLNYLKYAVYNTIRDDEELSDAFEKFEELLDSKDALDLYSNIDKPQEVISL